MNEQIKDNFYYCLFGGLKLVIDKNTGYFNATKLCADFNKRLNDWTKLDRTRKLMDYLGMELSWRDTGSANSYEVNDSSKHVTGQYYKREFLLDIALWVSVEFYFKCNSIIAEQYWPLLTPRSVRQYNSQSILPNTNRRY